MVGKMAVWKVSAMVVMMVVLMVSKMAGGWAAVLETTKAALSDNSSVE